MQIEVKMRGTSDEDGVNCSVSLVAFADDPYVSLRVGALKIRIERSEIVAALRAIDRRTP